MAHMRGRGFRPHRSTGVVPEKKGEVPAYAAGRGALLREYGNIFQIIRSGCGWAGKSLAICLRSEERPFLCPAVVSRQKRSSSPTALASV